ncbi:SRPBCC family protein [Mycolicibacterium palauense]|uniref:SRPBCC family protein n=1 Tax=Mycolicibacterium palauense TaxID=2034511 RepID=UPI000BFEBB85|nr:SRPBCC family protein [Mycolicibacterium palauense]
MTERRRARTVTASQDRIWQTLAAFGDIASWAGNVDHSCILTHPAEGAPVGTSRRIQAGHLTLVERIVEFDAPHTLAYTIEGLPRGLGRITNRWSLRPHRDGATVVTLTTRVDDGPGPLRRAAAELAARIVARSSDGMLADLAVAVQRSGVKP